MEQTIIRDFDVDAVITYVDNGDSVWQAAFKKTYEEEHLKGALPKCSESYSANRYNSHNELEICLFGIRKFMPWIRKVWLVVSNPEQVPEFAKKYNVSIVLHKDIIPEQFLPQFNSSAIELFLHRIPGLAERFVYFNDDFFTTDPVGKDHYFNLETGMPLNQFNTYKPRGKSGSTAWFMSFKNAYHTALKAAGLSEKYRDGTIDVLQHHAKALFIPSCDELWEKIPDVLEESITPFRSEKSINGYVFQLYDWYTGKCGRRTPEQERRHPFSQSPRLDRTFIVCNDNSSLQIDIFRKIKDKIGLYDATPVNQSVRH